jgi:uncharacterized iron-regulated membrane protein
LAGLRRLWLNVHLWLGVGLLIPVVLLGLSGTVLTFQDEIERLSNPARYAVSAGAPLQASSLLSMAREAAGKDFSVTSLRYPSAPGDPLIAQARTNARQPQSGPPQGLRIWIDPATGRVLDRANPRGGLMGVLHQLHGSLMIPDAGRKVVGWIGWGLFVSSLTGLWLWWPRNGAILKALRWTRGPRFTFNLHHLVGFWICIPLALLAATGVYISFPQSARTFTQTVLMQPAPVERRSPQTGGEGPGRGGGVPLANTQLSIDDAVNAALRAAPHAALSTITLPTKPRGDRGQVWRIDVRADDGKALTIEISDATGEAHVARAQNDNNVATTMRRLHDGVGQNILWRLVIALAGLAPAILGTTGLFMWLKPKSLAAPNRS